MNFQSGNAAGNRPTTPKGLFAVAGWFRRCITGVGTIAMLLSLSRDIQAQAVFFSEQEAGQRDGVDVVDVSFAGDLELYNPQTHDLNTNKSYEYTLPTEYTRSGYRWNVTYTMTQTDNSNKDVFARMEVLGSDGRTLDRYFDPPHFHGSLPAPLTYQFFGEDYQLARPQRIRFTFALLDFNAAARYSFKARLTACRVKGANLGGVVRENPLYMLLGDKNAPAYEAGDLRLDTEYHRFHLFYLGPGRTLHTTGTVYDTGICRMFYQIRDVDGSLLEDDYSAYTNGQLADKAIFTNKSATGKFITMGWLADVPFKSLKIGYYSDGPSQLGGTPIPPPSAAELDPHPYTAVSNSVATAGCPATPITDFGSGTTTRFELPGTGEKEVLRLRVRTVPFLGIVRGGGTSFFATVYAADNTEIAKGLAPRGNVTGAGSSGDEPAEIYWDHIDSAASGKSPSYVVVSTKYQACQISLESTRYTRTPPTTVPALLTDPSSGFLQGSTATVSWSAGKGVAHYRLQVGSQPGKADYFDQQFSSGTTTASVTHLPADASLIYVRLSSQIDGAWVPLEYILESDPGPAPRLAQIQYPTPDSKLTGDTLPLEWDTGVGVNDRWLYVGSTPGGNDYFDQDMHSTLSATVQHCPVDGSRIYVRLWSRTDSGWGSNYRDYTYTADKVEPQLAQITVPTATTLAGSRVTFMWSQGVGVQRCWLSVGSAVGGTDYFDADMGTAHTAVVTKCPINGSTVYVRLWSLINGSWNHHYVDTTYTAAILSNRPAEIASPTSSGLDGSRINFTWTAGVNVQRYWLYVGKTPGGSEYFNQNMGTDLSAIVNTCPIDGSQVYVTLWSMFDGAWSESNITKVSYTAANLPVTLASITSPTDRSPLSSASVTFQWTAGAGVSRYWLEAGSTEGGSQYYTADRGTNLQATVSGLPRDGSTVHVRLWSLVNGVWDGHYVDCSFTAATQ